MSQGHGEARQQKSKKKRQITESTMGKLNRRYVACHNVILQIMIGAGSRIKNPETITPLSSIVRHVVYVSRYYVR